jgi:UDP:flavonoid glycosyltransferase YjiC (YdhE family)
VRVLVSSTAGSGHFGPLVPLASACRDAGHDVAVAAPTSFAREVGAAGFEHLPFDDVPPEVLGPVFAGLPSMPFEQANFRVIGEVFGRLDAQAALPGVTEAIERWRPDLVLREPCEFASLVAAERAGIAQLQVAIGVAGMLERAWAALAEPLGELDALTGLRAGTAAELVASTAQLTWVPASLDEAAAEAFPVPGTGPRWRFRNPDWRPQSGGSLPAWSDDGLPLVYVSFGSVAASLGQMVDAYGAALAALADEPVRVLMTTGNALDPASLEPWPANALVERWRPQAEVMAHAAAVVGHGGFGTTMAALASGLPQVVLPLFASDQKLNAQHVAAAGAGIAVDGGPAAAGGLAPHVMAVLDDGRYRAAAAAIAAEISALPDPADAVPVLEQLAGAHPRKRDRPSR